MTLSQRPIAQGGTTEGPISRRSLRRFTGARALAAVSVLAVVGMSVLAQASTASPAIRTGPARESTVTRPLRSIGSSALSGANFTFSGAVQGTLHLSATDCKGDGGQGNGFQFNNSLKGFKAYKWLVNVSAPKKSGTWKTFPLGTGISIVLQAFTSTTDYSWYVKSGILTTRGTTGRLNVEVGPDPHQTASGKVGKGNIHIVATWSCAAGF